MANIKLDREGRVAILTLNRPEADNRITEQLGIDLVVALEEVRRDTGIAGCVLTGAGNVFCLGGDFRNAGTGVAPRMAFGRAHVDLYDAMGRLGKPLVAAVNGHAHAGGFAIVLGCDMVFMDRAATFGLPEVAHGLFPLLALAMAREALPKALLFEIVYEARPITAEEALALHLANKALARDEVLPAAIKAVETAARCDPDILMLGRDLYYSMRQLSPQQAAEQARFTLGTALVAMDAASGLKTS